MQYWTGIGICIGTQHLHQVYCRCWHYCVAALFLTYASHMLVQLLFLHVSFLVHNHCKLDADLMFDQAPTLLRYS